VLGLVGSYLGIYFYLRVIQLMFMSPTAVVTIPPAASRRLALSASLFCLATATLVAVVPGWVLGWF